MNIKITYDSSVDAAYIYLIDYIQPGGVAFTYPCDPTEVKGEINLDFDTEGRLIGIEILDASKMVPKSLLDKAEVI